MGSTRKFRRNVRKKENKTNREDNRKSYEATVRENADFEKYYKAQGLVGEGDWESFMRSMGSDLPTAFRISGSGSKESEALLAVVKGDLFAGLLRGEGEAEASSSSAGGGGHRPPPLPLPWYPRELGWQLEITRKDIRRSETYFRLHNFLTSETATGAISRQEAVSMIPPLLLDVRPHHKVLDMCAAPGSKTAQLIELLHSDESQLPSGLVVANDIDNSRCYMLVHQSKRLNSPCVLVTNHDATTMPNFKVDAGEREGGGGGGGGGDDGVAMKFDRILCDAPCSGDGTLRKNPDIWSKWNPANANNLHGVQYRVLRRGLEMLSSGGGRLVYSTCSLNPVEDEAVVARVLGETRGSVELLDVSSELPGLKSVPGLESWKVASKDLQLYSSFDEVDPKWRTQVRPSMFPPEDVGELNLGRCLRILPHLQDTGGFFVAVLVKREPLPWECRQPPPPAPTDPAARPGEGERQAEEAEDKEEPRGGGRGRGGPQRKKRKTHQGYREDPFVFFKEDEPVWTSIRDFYKMEGLDPRCLLTRCAVGKKKNVYFVSPVVRELVARNQERIKIINTGVKVFARCDNKSMLCCFRLVQEGLESIGRFVGGERRLSVSKEELVKVLERSDPANPLEASSLGGKTLEALDRISPGSCVLDCDEGTGGDGLRLSLSLVGWKGARSLRAYVSLQDGVHYLRLLGADVSRFEVNKFKKEGETKPEEDESKGKIGGDIEAGDEKEATGQA